MEKEERGRFPPGYPDGGDRNHFEGMRRVEC
jgi:hypothetical protein